MCVRGDYWTVTYQMSTHRTAAWADSDRGISARKRFFPVAHAAIVRYGAVALEVFQRVQMEKLEKGTASTDERMNGNGSVSNGFNALEWSHRRIGEFVIWTRQTAKHINQLLKFNTLRPFFPAEAHAKFTSFWPRHEIQFAALMCSHWCGSMSSVPIFVCFFTLNRPSRGREDDHYSRSRHCWAKWSCFGFW